MQANLSIEHIKILLFYHHIMWNYMSREQLNFNFTAYVCVLGKKNFCWHESEGKNYEIFDIKKKFQLLKKIKYKAQRVQKGITKKKQTLILSKAVTTTRKKEKKTHRVSEQRMRVERNLQWTKFLWTTLISSSYASTSSLDIIFYAVEIHIYMQRKGKINKQVVEIYVIKEEFVSFSSCCSFSLSSFSLARGLFCYLWTEFSLFRKFSGINIKIYKPQIYTFFYRRN